MAKGSIIFVSSINAIMLAMNRGEYTIAKTAVSAAAELYIIIAPLELQVFFENFFILFFFYFFYTSILCS